MFKRSFISLLLLVTFSNFLSAQLPKLKFQSNESLSFEKMIAEYEKADAASPYMALTIAGYSDAGNPIHLFIIDKQQQFKPNPQLKKAVWFILNGIHPGESEGIDASVAFVNALIQNPQLIPDSVSIIIVPSYNVDGMRNRKHYTRANQNGPDEKGFRASANNLDLNRDFIKADSKNTQVFYQIFQNWQPHIFLDTHTSNGADYQYTITLISTQEQKLGGPAADFLYKKMNPFLFQNMKKKGLEMSPYVNVFSQSPDAQGFEVFVEGPKFSTGYTSLFACLGFVAETHMLKAFPDRVNATYELLGSFLQFIKQNKQELVRTKSAQQQWMKDQRIYNSNFKVDRNSHKNIAFKGFEMELKPSKIGNYERDFYNRNKPYIKTIPYYDSCKASWQGTVPSYFLIPAAWQKAIDLLNANHIEMMPLVSDSVISVRTNYIDKIQYASRPYEGHFVHSGIETKVQKMAVKFYKGDLIIPSQQNGIWYLMETLSAQTSDGFMAWNFFDPILNEKEGFSDYAFEEDAIEFLANDSLLQQKFENWKTQYPEKAKSKFEVLGYIYKNSPYFEKEYLRFPVYTIE